MSLDEITHNCGVVVAHSLHDVYCMMKDLQHRGRDAAGIAGIASDRIDVLKWIGTVSDFDLHGLTNAFFPIERGYHTFLGHVRYATRGGKDQLLEHAHPQFIGGNVEHRGNHIYATNCAAAIVHNGQVDLPTEGSDSLALLQYCLDHGERNLICNIPGSYTAAIADIKRKDVIVIRDRVGNRPGDVILKDGKYCVVSEDIAARKNDGIWIEELARGHIYYFNPNGGFQREKVIKSERKLCFFELNYIASPESTLIGRSVSYVRAGFGVRASKEFRPNVDYVTHVPNSPIHAALRYSIETGIPHLHVFNKTRNKRSFQGPNQDERERVINEVLLLIPGIDRVIRGKSVLVFEDSTVRGTVVHRVAELLNSIGVKSYVYNYTPPIGIIGADGVPRGCYFGVDMPSNDNFIARRNGKNLTSEEISQIVGIPIGYLSLEGMLQVFDNVGIRADQICTHCIGGEHPFKN